MARAHRTSKGGRTANLGGAGKFVATQVRLPVLLHARIVLLAHTEGFALNAYVVKLLELATAERRQPSLFPEEGKVTDEPSR